MHRLSKRAPHGRFGVTDLLLLAACFLLALLVMGIVHSLRYH